jgi:hypothetical protein
MGGSSPVVDPQRNVYVASADGYNLGAGQPYDDSDAVLELSPAMHLESIFYLKDWQQLSGDDLDFGTEDPCSWTVSCSRSARRTPPTCCVRGISVARMARSRRFRCATETQTADAR